MTMSTPVNEKPSDLRKNPRITLPERVEVLDAHNGRALGQLVNLSVEGLMLVGPVCVSPGTVYQLRVPLTRDNTESTIVIGVESLWCQDANDSGSYWTGFHIIDISPQHRELLHSVAG